MTMRQSETDRINTLYHRSQSAGLTEEGKGEQAGLETEYITVIHNNMRVNLSNISIQEKDGGATDLGKKSGSIKEVQQA